MRFIISIVLAVITLSGAVLSAQKWMTDDELRRGFSNSRIEGFYRDGRMFMETYKADHSLDYIEGSRRQSGYWKIVSGTFCTIYDGMPSGGCYRVHVSIRRRSPCLNCK